MMKALGPLSLRVRHPAAAARGGLARRGLLALSLLVGSLRATVPAVHQLSPTLYHTEHCLFVIDGGVTWNSPTVAYNEIYAAGATAPYFPRLAGYFDALVQNFPANYFSVCYIANTGAANVPNYIDRQYKATGISSGVGSAGLGASGVPGTPQSFASVDFCRYNLPGGLVTPALLGVFDHEIGHAWGAQLFYFLNQPGLSNGHWLANSTVDCQLSSSFSDDGYATVTKLLGDPVQGFRWHRVDNARGNDRAVFSEQALYLLGVSPRFADSYVLTNPVYHSDGTVSYSSVDTFDQAAAVAAYGVRNPDYQTAPKRFKLGFIYIARDANEVTAVAATVEASITNFCEGEQLSATTYRAQTPFLVDTHYRASVDGLLGELDGNHAPALTMANGFSTSVDGTATVNFTATDPDGPAPEVALVPASLHAQVVGGQVQCSGLPDGTHFFTLKAEDAGGRKVFAHFVVDVQRPVTTLAVTTEPDAVTATAGGTAALHAGATGGDGAFTYRWYRQQSTTSTWNVLTEGGGYGGTATATLAVTADPASDGDRFLCVIDDGTTAVTTRSALLTVDEQAPLLLEQPAARAVTPGSSTYFRVTAGDDATTFGYFHYQWQRCASGENAWQDVVDDANFVGANRNQLSIYGPTLAMDGEQFRCVVSNTAGAITSQPALLAVGLAPVIVTQPQPVATNAGATATLTVTATGSGVLTYQWFNYAAPVGSGSTLVLANIQPSDAGTYGVHISNAFGTAYSTNVSVTVGSGPVAPAVTAVLSSATRTAGQAMTWTATATGSAPLTYQWRRNGGSIPGATAATLALPALAVADSGDYDVVVSNSAGAAFSSVATLNVLPIAATLSLSGLNTVYDGSAHVAGVTTVPRGLATSLAYDGSATAPARAGSYAVVAVITAADYMGTASGTLVIAPAMPGITWTTPSPLAAGSVLDSSRLNATATVPGTFVYTPPVGSVVNSGTTSLHVDFFPTDALNFAVTGATVAIAVQAAAAAPVFTAQPVSQTFAVGYPATFTTAVTANPACNYQWSHDGVAVVGAVQASLTLPLVSLGDSGVYQVFATNTVGTASSAAAVLTVVPRVAASGGAADFNGDGKADLLWSNALTGERAMWLMNGTGFLFSSTLGNFPLEWTIAATGDFNADGKTDVVWSNSITGERAIWLMNGTSLITSSTLGIFPLEWTVAATADFNADGKPDLIWSNSITGERAIWLMNGVLYQGSSTLGVFPLEWTVAATADFNADGKPDIIWSNRLTGERAIWLMNGTSFLAASTLGTFPLEWTVAGSADFNADGKPDIIWSNAITGERALWLMNGTSFLGASSLGIFPLEWTVSN